MLTHGMFSTERILGNRQRSVDEKVELLFELGHFLCDRFPDRKETTLDAIKKLINGKLTHSMFEQATYSYQSFIGQNMDGHFGKETESSLKQRSCGCPDIEEMGNIRKWGHRDITVWLSDGTSGRDQFRRVGKDYDEVLETCRKGLEAWNKVCNINLHFLPADTDERPNIYVYWIPIDGSNGTLAWMTLPWSGISTTQQLQGRMDPDEMWTLKEGGRGIEMDDVWRHEIGHGIGISHVQDSNATMYFAYGQNRDILNATDIREAQARYGQPVDRPDEPDSPSKPPKGKSKIVIEVPKTLRRNQYDVKVTN